MDQSLEIVEEPQSILATLDELLRRPTAGVERARLGAPVGAWAGRVMFGSCVCCVLYGAGSGFFAGGAQIGIAAVKAPIIVAFTGLLCLPSLYVFGLLAGAQLSRERFIVTVAGFVGMLALVLVGLLPVEWLFSVSSKSLAFVVWLHLTLWAVAILFGARFLRAALPEMSRVAIVLWLILFCVVSFQVTTLLRPTLWRATSDPIVERGKMFFLDHFNKTVS
jgi:hypothetical protein